MARPSIFSDDVAASICSRISAGESLRKICVSDDMPCLATVHYWLLNADKKEFLEQYKQAQEIRASSMFDELLEIADDSTDDVIATENGERANTEFIQRSKVRIDTRKWVLSRMNPKKYGDKVENTVLGDLTVRSAKDLTDEQLAAIASGSCN